MHENKNPLVTDPRDPRYLKLQSLQTEAGRSQSGLYIIEGIRHLARAAEQHAAIELLFADPSVLANPFGQKLIRRIRQSGIPSIRLDRKLYRQLTLAADPQGVGAVLRQRWFSLPELNVDRHSLWLAIESVDQPGNLGTILRTAEAAGVTGVFLLGQGADPWDPACIRASMGALFSQKLVRCTIAEFSAWARSSRLSVIGSSPAGLLSYRELRFRWPAVLLIGSEKSGLSQQLLDACDFTVRIPMQPGCDSVNAAVAAGVLLFELSGTRQSTFNPARMARPS
jgi:RNA methyltransferase, TrmH family